MKNMKFYICPCCGQEMDELVGGKSKYKKGGFLGSRPFVIYIS